MSKQQQQKKEKNYKELSFTLAQRFTQILIHNMHIVTCVLNTYSKNVCNRMCCIHVPGHDPLIFSFLSLSFLTGWEFYGPSYLRC